MWKRRRLFFHSFQDFSVPADNAALFNNAENISNIFSRVTGGNVSNGNLRITGGLIKIDNY